MSESSISKLNYNISKKREKELVSISTVSLIYLSTHLVNIHLPVLALTCFKKMACREISVDKNQDRESGAYKIETNKKIGT